MYTFLQVIDYYFNTKLENSRFIKNLQNGHTFIVSLGCAAGLYYYKTQSYEIVPYLQKAILAQCTADLFLNSKPDIFIHHVITISMIGYALTQPYSLESLHYKYVVVISCELSSIFLVINNYVEHNTMLSAINTGFFLSSFFYTRIVLFAQEILFDEQYITHVKKNNIWYSLNVYSFLFINIYWGSIIVKSLYKHLRRMMKPYHTSLNTEFLLQYTLFLSPIASASTYMLNSASLSNTTIHNMLLDVTGLAAVSASSYGYHNALYKHLGSTTEKINVLGNSIYPFYMSDIITIHIRSFLISSVSFSQIEDIGLRCILITNNALFHIITLHIFYDHHCIKRNSKKIIIYDENESLVSCIVKLPLILDTIIVAYHCQDMLSRNHIVLATAMIFATMVVKPFYEMNHFFFHLLLIYQSFAGTQGFVRST